MIHVEETRSATAADVEQWCEQAGDSNPLHLSSEVAAGSRFGERVVPGVLALGWVSGCIGQLGEVKDGVVILTGLDADFSHPIYLDEDVRVVVREADTVVEFEVIKDDDNTVAIAGTATIHID